MRLLFLDIETVRNALPWTPPLNKPDAFPPIPCWDIVCIGGMLITVKDGKAAAKLKIVEGTPAEACLAVARIAREADLVTFNGRAFDLPVIESTILRRPDAVAPRLFSKAVRGRYDSGHIDVSDYLTNHGSIAPVSFDLWCKSVGLAGKGDTHGADVAELVAAGRLADVHAYCLSDVAQTGLLAMDALRASGGLTVEIAEIVEAEIWRAVDAVPGLAWVADCPRRRLRDAEGIAK